MYSLKLVGWKKGLLAVPLIKAVREYSTTNSLAKAKADVERFIAGEAVTFDFASESKRSEFKRIAETLLATCVEVNVPSAKISIAPNESLDSSEVAIVAEVTSPAEPDFDDHFLLLVLNSGRVVEIVLGSPEAYRVIADLESALGSKLDRGLAHITEHASLILYPKSLAGKPLYDFTTITVPEKKTWLTWLTGRSQCVMEEYTAEVKELLQKAKA